MFKKNVGLMATALLLLSSPAVFAAEIPSSDEGEKVEAINEIYLYDGGTEGGGVSGEVAPDSYNDFGFNELFTQWEINGYPDNVGYVIFDNDLGKMVVGLLDNSPAAQNEIIVQLTQADAVAFEQATYSYNEMMAVLDEMAAVYESDSENIFGYGFGWAVIDGDLTGFGPSGNELRVTLEVTEAVQADYVAEMNALYGDKVVVVVGAAASPLDIISTTDMYTTMENTMAVNETNNYNTILIIGLIGFTSLVAFYQRRQRPLKQTTDGSIVTGVDRNEVIESIKGAKIEPSEDVYRSIQDKIK